MSHKMLYRGHLFSKTQPNAYKQWIMRQYLSELMQGRETKITKYNSFLETETVIE